MSRLAKSAFSQLRNSSRKQRRLHLESLERRQLMAEMAKVTLDITNLAGDSVTTLATGQEYYLKAFVQDTRSTGAQGVTTAFFDVAVNDNDLITIEDQTGANAGILFSADFPGGQTASNLIETLSQEFDEVGAFTVNQYGAANSPFFQVKFSADAAGSLTFGANPADALGNLFALADTGPIDASSVTYGSVTVNVVDPTALTDDNLTIDEDADESTIDVLDNDTGGASTWTIESISQISAGGNVTIAADGKSVLYTPAADFSGTETFRYNTTDGLGAIGQATVTVTVNAQNDLPVNTIPGEQIFTQVDPTVVFGAANQISIADSDVGSGNMRVTLFVGQGQISLASTTGLTFLNSSANNTNYLLFDGTPDDINAALLNLTYTANSGVTSDVLTIDTHDLGNTGSGGAGVDRDTIGLSLDGPLSENQSPVNTTPGDQLYTSIDPTVTFGAVNQVSINDPDAGNQLVRVTLFVNNGSIALSQTSGLSFLNGSTDNSGYLLFDGTQADVNAALSGMVYTANLGSAQDVFTIDTHDLGNSGTGGAKIDRDSFTVTLAGAGLNQTPVNSVPGAQIFNSTDRTVTFDATNQISISDPDAGESMMRVTLFANNGTISLASTAGLTFLNSSVNNSQYLLFDGSQSDFNAALVNLTYTANSDVSADLITIDTHDLGHTGFGPAQIDRDTIAVTLDGSAENDSPINTVPGQQFYTSGDRTVEFGLLNRVATNDPDVGGESMRVTLFVGNGSINLSTTSGLTFLNGSANGDKYLLFDGTQEDINNALFQMTYTASANSTSDLFTIDVHDLGNSGTGGAKIDRDSFAISQFGTLPNIAPFNIVPGRQTYSDANPTITFGLLNPVQTIDLDAGSQDLRVTLFVNSGVINLDSTDGLEFLNGSANGTRYLLFDGSQQDINSALSGMTYSADEGSDSDLLTIDTHDLGNSGTGGAKTDRDTVQLARNTNSTNGRFGFGGSGEAGSRNTASASTPVTSPAAASADVVLAQPASGMLPTDTNRSALQLADLLASSNSGRARAAIKADALFGAMDG